MKKLLTPVAVAVSLAAGSMVAPTLASAELSGNIGVHSKYLLRGIFEENPDTAVQGGLDWSGDTGWYAGWWFSNLGYTYDSGSTGVDVTERGFENDLYGGYAGEMDNGLGYDIGLIQYAYVNVDDSNLTELTGTLSMGGGYVGFQYLLNDGWWGNSGDVYWKAGYAMDLANDFGLAFDLGYYTYDDNDNSDLGSTTLQTSGFRHFNVTLSHPVGNTGADMYVQYVFAGEDRSKNEYDDSMVAGLTYGFDI